MSVKHGEKQANPNKTQTLTLLMGSLISTPPAEFDWPQCLELRLQQLQIPSPPSLLSMFDTAYYIYYVYGTLSLKTGQELALR